MVMALAITIITTTDMMAMALNTVQHSLEVSQEVPVIITDPLFNIELYKSQIAEMETTPGETLTVDTDFRQIRNLIGYRA